jgi:hypothetical protein
MSKLLTEKLTAQRYSVTTRTLRRWDITPDLKFPPPVYVNGRRYRDAVLLDRWDKSNSRLAAERMRRPASEMTDTA